MKIVSGYSESNNDHAESLKVAWTQALRSESLALALFYDPLPRWCCRGKPHELGALGSFSGADQGEQEEEIWKTDPSHGNKALSRS